MVYFYHVTGHKPSAVISSCTGHFTGPEDLNLIIAKNTYLEIHEVTAYGLKLLKEIPIFGRIVAIKLFKRKNKVAQSLFVVTEKAQAAVIECQKDQDNSYEFITLASGSFEERSALMIDKGFSVLVDNKENFIVMRFYKGILKVIPLASLQQAENNGDKSNQTLAAKTVRIEEYNVMDMAFLDSQDATTLAILHEGSVGTEVKLMHLQSDCALTQLPNGGRSEEVEPDACMLIPVSQPYGGFIVVALQVITYYAPMVAGSKMQKISQYIPITQKSNILCYGTVDAKRYLLGDLTGRLYMLHLLTASDQEALGLTHSEPSSSKNSQEICGIQLQLLGEITIPESINYLDNGVLFIGSRLGDSQLVRLISSTEQEVDNSQEKPRLLWNGSPDYVRVLESVPNIGPIVDMILMEWDRQGQSQLVTASGAFKNGSLRVIRNGIGIQEHASIDQDMIKAIWCFKINSEQYDDSILLSLVGQSKMLSLNQDDIEPSDVPGLETELQTYHAAMLQPGYLLQVTSVSLRLIKIGSGLVQEWHPPNQKSVSHCSSNADQIIVASGPEIYYLRFQDGKFVDINQHILDNEVACLDLTPFNAEGAASIEASESKLVAVGLWIDFSIVLLTLPELKVVHTQPLKTSIIPRSLLITQFESTPYLFVGLGDGVLLSFVVDTNTGTLRDEKRVHVGTGPMTLRRWLSHMNKIHVFVCSDHPCIIYSANQKLVFANVNLKEVTFMSTLNSEYYLNCLAIVSPDCMIFGSVDEVQKLHIRSIPLEESPRRLTWQEETGILGVISYRTEQILSDGQFKPTRDTAISLQQKVSKSKSPVPKTLPSGNTAHNSSTLEVQDIQVSSLLIFDHTAFELQHVHTFSYASGYSETAISITSCKELMSHPILIVGTALQTSDSLEEPKHGRLAVFKWTENGGPLEYLFDYEIKGAPYQVLEFNGKLLVTVNSYVYLYELKENSFVELACYCDSIISLFMKKKGDFVLVGDIMRSLYLLRFSEITKKLDLIGKHMKPRWVSSIEIIDDDHFLSSESTNNNLFVVTKENEPTNYNKNYFPQLNEHAWFHTGEFINTFLHGSMVMQNNLEHTLPISVPLLYGSVFGAVGLVCQLSAGLYHLLSDVEKRLNQMIHTAGDFSQSTWRSVLTDKGVRPVKNFIDGDLIESFLDLSLADKQKIVENLRIFNDLGSLTLSADNTRPCQLEDLVKIIEELSRMH